MLGNAASGLGLDRELPMVSFPIDVFLVDSDISPVIERFDRFVARLTRWRPGASERGIRQPSRLRIQGRDFEHALDRMNQHFLASTWGDGLPLYAPTPARVDWILRGSDRDRDEVVGRIMPRGGIATTETLAVSLAMAGGRPEYLPLLVAAVDAFLDPALQHDTMQATSGSTFPVVIVNGPVAGQVRLNSGFGLLGPDPQHPAGASIGRALRLLQQNVGGALPGVGTMALFGGMRYTNAVFAEDEGGLPDGWSTVSEEHGGGSANQVTVVVATGMTNVVRRGYGKEAPMEEAQQGLARLASYLSAVSVHYTQGWAEGCPGVLLLPRPVARQLHALGWTTKQSVKRDLLRMSALSAECVRESGLRQWIAATDDPRTAASLDEDPWPIARTPEQLILAVAGGDHPTHGCWMQAKAPGIASREIQLPGEWETLLAEADVDLGAGGDACRIGGGETA